MTSIYEPIKEEEEEIQAYTQEEILNSWVVAIIKETMGVEIVRNDILRYFLRNLPQHNIIYGPTFSIGISKERLYKFLNEVIAAIQNGEDKIILFTCNNNYGPLHKTSKMIETHYQTFIVQTQKKRITMIDPSRRRTREGMYSPYAAMVIYLYIKGRMEECKFYWLKMTDPCQVKYSSSVDINGFPDNDDVFCQSWSLYLLISALQTNSTLIYIPYRIEEKYNILVEFYHEILKNVPIFYQEFQAIWKEVVIKKNRKIEFRDRDIREFILAMKGSDLYYNTDMIYVKPETAKNYVNTVSKEEIEQAIKEFMDYNKSYQKVITPEMMHSLKNSIQVKSPIREFINTPINELPRTTYLRSPEDKKRRRSIKRSPGKRSSDMPFEKLPGIEPIQWNGEENSSLGSIDSETLDLLANWD